jgi:hypothetical protein
MTIVSENAWYISPELRNLYYIRGILRRRLYYVNEDMALSLLIRAERRGVIIQDLKELALVVENWIEWRTNMEEWIQCHDD